LGLLIYRDIYILYINSISYKYTLVFISVIIVPTFTPIGL